MVAAADAAEARDVRRHPQSLLHQLSCGSTGLPSEAGSQSQVGDTPRGGAAGWASPRALFRRAFGATPRAWRRGRAGTSQPGSLVPSRASSADLELGTMVPAQGAHVATAAASLTGTPRPPRAAPAAAPAGSGTPATATRAAPFGRPPLPSPRPAVGGSAGGSSTESSPPCVPPGLQQAVPPLQLPVGALAPAAPQQQPGAAPFTLGSPPKSPSPPPRGVRRGGSLPPDLPTVVSQEVLHTADLPSLPPLHIPAHHQPSIIEDAAQWTAGTPGSGISSASPLRRLTSPFGALAAQPGAASGQLGSPHGRSSGEEAPGGKRNPAAVQRTSTSSTVFWEGERGRARWAWHIGAALCHPRLPCSIPLLQARRGRRCSAGTAPGG